MTRRELLWYALSAGLLAPVAARRAWPILSGRPELVAHRLLDLFGSHASASVVGIAYLERHPEERDCQRILRELDLGPMKMDCAQIRGLVVQRQREDFARGRVVRVEGWILSETEARLCALAAL